MLGESPPSFHVYENWIAEGHKCRVHRSDCSFCNGGRGVRPLLGSRNGVWHGPFPTYEEALAYGALRSPDTRACGICRPEAPRVLKMARTRQALPGVPGTAGPGTL